MTQLQLVKHDVNSSNLNQIVAVSTSHKALTKFCKETYNKPVTDADDETISELYFTIGNTDIKLVPEN